MKFTKMHGLGNDYVYVDAFEQSVRDPARLAVRISDRHTGVGSDGLIIIRPSKVADVGMLMFNADGSRAEMCGNGIRCVAKYAIEHRRVPCDLHAAQVPLRVETDAGVKDLVATLQGGRVVSVKVNMGRASFDVADLPARYHKPRIIDEPIDIDGTTFRVTCVSVGNPHAILFVEDAGAVDLTCVGPRLEGDAMFPRGVNVHVAEVLSERELKLRSWERGSGLTRACGTGAVAALAAGVITNRTARSAEVHLPGGDLHVKWDANDHLWMTGPAAEVFTGEWPEPC